MNPYCEQPECHDSFTAYYAPQHWWTGTGGNPAGQWFGRVWMSLWPFPSARRLCRIHARHEFGISFGGRA